jgi:hypothetical protein
MRHVLLAWATGAEDDDVGVRRAEEEVVKRMRIYLFLPPWVWARRGYMERGGEERGGG